MNTSDSIRYLVDAAGNIEGVLLPPEIWSRIEPEVQKLLAPAEEEEKPERLQDWNMLVDYWDFQYPVNYEVVCGHCGEQTGHFIEDEPRKFKVRSANLGGLVTFECQGCKARVLKKHFKDEFTFETQPCRDAKDPRLNAAYGEDHRTGRRK